ncbi:hypothetical protein [Flammeovirga aprica]|uniref:ATP-grasp domain-containing protein n=1 Tax=Flammeovirga aprica JL-4 TaxID=694437 RepID=A0A7X9S0U8_9BACT|nr:hypothetical protein [Flammeovirga aprica]NME72330.1 hypothetical protein [Flammeovirga aprica JL-4]
MKGDLWLFNPHCELSILKEQQHYTPPKMIRKVQNDLSMLMVWLADENDSILTENHNVNKEWLSLLQSVVGFDFKFESPKSIKDHNRTFSGVKYWGKSPSIVTDLRFLSPKYNQYFEWNSEVRKIFHREFGYDVLSYVVDNESSNVISSASLGRFCTRVDEVEDEINKVFSTNPYGVIMKLPFSSSGRGILVLKRNEITPSVKKWMESALNQQDSILVEPLLQKVFDFSLLFKKCKNEITFLGGSSFLAGLTGQYYGSALNSFQQSFSSSEWKTILKVIDLIKNKLKGEKALEGHFGIDALMFEDSNGERIIHPCIEINPRYTMGHITLRLEKAVPSHKRAEWRIVTKHEVKDFTAFENEMEKKHPLQIDHGKVQSGFLPLVDVNLVQNYYAYLLVKDEEI